MKHTICGLSLLYIEVGLTWFVWLKRYVHSFSELIQFSTEQNHHRTGTVAPVEHITFNIINQVVIAGLYFNSLMIYGFSWSVVNFILYLSPIEQSCRQIVKFVHHLHVITLPILSIWPHILQKHDLTRLNHFVIYGC